MSILSSDGQTIFFTRFANAENLGGRYAGTDIWSSTRQGTRWQKATNTRVPFNSSGNNAIVGTNSEGDVLYLVDSSPNKKIKGIYFSKRRNGIWQHAESIPIPGIDNVAGHIGFYVSSDFTVILISMQGSDSQGEEDIYVSLEGKKRHLVKA